MTEGPAEMVRASFLEAFANRLSELKAIMDINAKVELLASLELSTTLVRDWSGAIRFWPKGCESVYGWSANEALGRDAHELLSASSSRNRAEILTTLLRDGEWSGEIVHRRKDGARIAVKAHKALRRDASGAIASVAISVNDITSLKKSEIELRRRNMQLRARADDALRLRDAARAELTQGEKLAAVGRLVSGVAHDYRNVASVMASGAQLLDRYAEVPEKVRHYAHSIANAASSATSISERLLAMSRRRNRIVEPVNIAELMHGLGEILNHVFDRRIVVTVRVDAGLPAALVERGGLETVLLNLTTNARDAIRGAGRITLTAEFAGDGHPTAYGASGPLLRIAVSDDGCGMDKATLARAAEPFFTTKDDGAGTGLGLSQAQCFAQQCGGALKIDSAPGVGTTVSLWLPVAPS